MFRRRSAGATDGTSQDSPGAQSPDGPADTKPRSPAEAAKGLVARVDALTLETSGTFWHANGQTLPW